MLKVKNVQDKIQLKCSKVFYKWHDSGDQALLKCVKELK